MTTDPIIVTQTYAASMERVWSAITDPVQMKRWFFEQIEDFRPEVGFETRFNVPTPHRDFMHHWTITAVEPGRSITYRWEYDGLPGVGTVIFDVAEDNGQTHVTLTNLGLESFPKDQLEFTREACIGGWNYFLGERLQAFLAQS